MLLLLDGDAGQHGSSILHIIANFEPCLVVFQELTTYCFFISVLLDI